MGQPATEKHKEINVTDATRQKPRWRVLPEEGEGECDYDPETSRAFDQETEKDARRGAASWQAAEAIRLAKEYALLRPGTRREEIKKERIKEAMAVIAAWMSLVRQLKDRRRLP
jgi:hypothetical protein